MERSLEYEYKTMLTQDEYLSLLPFFHDGVKLIQVNYYFFLPEEIQRQHRITLRIRKIDDQYRLQMKEQTAPHTFVEHEVVLTEEAWQQACENNWQSNDILKLLEEKYQVKSTMLHYAGALTTIRYEKRENLGLFCCDYNSYLGIEDYELEVEVEPGTALEELQPFLHRYGIPYRQAVGKVARFWQRLKATK